MAAWVAGSMHGAPEADPWFGPDKALHFSASAAIAGAGYAGAAAIGVEQPGRWIGGAALALTAGVLKESIDLAGGGDASWRDLTWDAVGAVVGLVIVWGVDELFFSKSATQVTFRRVTHR